MSFVRTLLFSVYFFGMSVCLYFRPYSVLVKGGHGWVKLPPVDLWSLYVLPSALHVQWPLEILGSAIQCPYVCSWDSSNHKHCAVEAQPSSHCTLRYLLKRLDGASRAPPQGLKVHFYGCWILFSLNRADVPRFWPAMNVADRCISGRQWNFDRGKKKKKKTGFTKHPNVVVNQNTDW